MTQFFISIYAPYKHHLPLQTSILFSVYNALWIVPFLLTLLTWFKWPRNDRRHLAAVIAGAVGGAVIVGVAYWAGFQRELVLTAIQASP